MKATRLALYSVAALVVVVALLVCIASLPPQPAGPDTNAKTTDTPSVPVVIEPANPTPTTTPKPSPTLNRLTFDI